MNKITLAAVYAAVLLAALPSSAGATVEFANPNACSAETPDNCLNGVGPAVTNPDSIRVSASRLSSKTSRHAGEDDDYFSLTGQADAIGRSAGGNLGGWGFWLSYSRSSFEADLPINSAVQPVASYDATQNNALFGADRLFADRWILGLAIGLEDSQIDTAYNGGDNESDGFTIAPYAAFLINNTFSIDATAGYTDLDYDTRRIDNVSGGTISADFDAERWFAAANLNANVRHNQWLFGGKVGILYTEETQDGYTETGPNTARTINERKLDLTQFIAGVNAAYSFNRLEPFVSLYYLNDISSDDGIGAGGLPADVGNTQPNDDDEFQAGMGFRYFGDVLSASLEWNSILDRSRFDGHSLFLTLRCDL